MVNHPPGQRPDSAFDGIDFEPTDISDARRAMDDLPPGVGELERLVPGYWEQQRRPPSAADRALTGAAVDWLMRLPQPLRPNELSQRFPRLANALAAVWGDAPRAAEALDGLLVDRRGGRRGLPDAVRAELQALQDHLVRTRAKSAPGAPAAANAEEALARARALLEAAGYRVIPPA
jgi:hypothetical protein